MRDDPASPDSHTCRSCGSPTSTGPGALCLACLGTWALRTEDEHGGAPPAGLTVPGRLGEFELIEELGRGGMGVVYAARQPGLNRIVALKVLGGTTPTTPEAQSRFEREAVSIARLHHPNIVAVHAAGRFEGRLYYAMDLVDGLDLTRVCVPDPLDPHDAAQLVAAVARAIHHAHEAGIVHRDLKPSNVLLDADETPRVVDFGIARWIQEPADLTRTGQILGSPAFMAPEQAIGQSSPAGDIHALGGLLFFTLTGRPPFEGETALEVLGRVTSDPARPPGALRPGVPPPLDAITLRCLAKRPADRYGTALEVADDLERWLAGAPVNAPEAPVAEALRLVAEVRAQAGREGYQFALIEGFTAKLTRAVQLAPDLAAAHAELCLLHATMVSLGIDATQARRDLARQSAERAEALDPQSVDTRCARAITLLNAEGRAAEAWPQLAALAAELPGDVRLQGIHGRAAIKLGRWREAKASLQRRLTALEPDSPQPRQLLAWVHGHLREYGDAVVWIEDALRIDPRPAYRRLVRAWYRWLADPEPTRALRDLRALPEAERRDRTVAWCEAQLLLALGRPAEAFLAYRTSVATPEGWSTQAAEENAHLLRLARWAREPLAAEIETELRRQLAPGRTRRAASPKEALQQAYAFAALGRREEALALAD
ncbi:MAG: protein kinase, partial [Opitutaceae bacterium]|nr:protein kinase [Opitutaceae bacterium]